VNSMVTVSARFAFYHFLWVNVIVVAMSKICTFLNAENFTDTLMCSQLHEFFPSSIQGNHTTRPSLSANKTSQISQLHADQAIGFQRRNHSDTFGTKESQTKQSFHMHNKYTLRIQFVDVC
jgi:hypothetical protein